MSGGPLLKVLHVIGSLGMGGAETWLMELLRYWSKTGAGRLEFLATSGERGIFDAEATRLGARIHYVAYRRAHLRQFVGQFRRILHEGQFDAIHDHADYASGWHFLMGAGQLPAVRVTHVHNPRFHIDVNYGVSPTRRVTAMTGKRLVHRFATNVCGTSAEILKEYGFHAEETTGPVVSVAYCGIDVDKFNAPREADRESVLREFGWPETTKLVLFAGRMDRALQFEHPQNHKNSWFALNVARTAVCADPSVRLLMVGAGGEAAPQLEARVRGWGMETELRLTGIRNDMPRLMRAADVLFFPSRQEGLGMVAVEAQAAGTPILASTAVPRECVVVADLYDALPLADPIDRWADTLLLRMIKQRPSVEFCRQTLETSPFSIANSSHRLEQIYGNRLHS